MQGKVRQELKEAGLANTGNGMPARPLEYSGAQSCVCVWHDKFGAALLSSITPRGSKCFPIDLL